MGTSSSLQVCITHTHTHKYIIRIINIHIVNSHIIVLGESRERASQLKIIDGRLRKDRRKN